jgi:hypothetical protein
LSEGIDSDAWDRQIHAHFAGQSVWVRSGGRYYHVSSACERINPGCYEVTLTLDYGGLPEMRNRFGGAFHPCPDCSAIPRYENQPEGGG